MQQYNYKTWKWLLWPFFFFGILSWWVIQFVLIFLAVFVVIVVLAVIL